MGYVLRTKDGKYITRPINFSATDEQVRNQLQYMADNGTFPSFEAIDILDEKFTQIEKEFSDMMIAIDGEETPDPISVTWDFGEVSGTTGAIQTDAQKQRIISNRIIATVPMKVTFSNTSKYKYHPYYYDANGNFLGDNLTWMSDRSFVIERGTQCIIKVRENNYAVWDDDRIAAFTDTISFEWMPLGSLSSRVDAVENLMISVDENKQNIRENANAILALRNTVDEIENNSQTNLIVQHIDNFFPDLENGEISWSDGTEISQSPLYARSSGYKLVDTDDAIFVAKLPTESTIVSFYAYEKSGSSYVFTEVSNWFHNGDTFRPQKGLYHRALFYDTQQNALDKTALKVALTGSVVSEIIDKVVESFGNGTSLLDYELTNAEMVEMNKTKEDIKSAVSNPSCSVIGWFTDLHLDCNAANTTSGRNITRTQKHLTMYNKIVKDIDIDLLLFGGDYLQNSPQTPKVNAVNSLSLLKKFIAETSHVAPIAVLKGNHDDNTMYTDYKNGYVDDVTRWNILQNVDQKSTNRNADYLEKAYGYYDIPNQKIRVFYLNSIDVPTSLDESANTLKYPGQGTTGFSEEQIQFVADHLHFSESGWQVLFFSHHSIKRNPFPAPMANTGVVANHGGAALEAVLQAFMSKDSGAYANSETGYESLVTFDFTDNKSNTIIACINGHTHYDCAVVIDNINWIATRAIDGHATYGFQDTSVYVVVNRKERKVSLIANGEGENRTFVY